MLKGVNKQIIEIKNTNNPYFERAILFVNPEKNGVKEGEKNFQAKKFFSDISPDKAKGEKTGFLKKVAIPILKVMLQVGLGALLATIIINFK